MRELTIAGRRIADDAPPEPRKPGTWMAWSRTPAAETTCVVCGAKFLTKRLHHGRVAAKYCSPRCCSQASWQAHGEERNRRRRKLKLKLSAEEKFWMRVRKLEGCWEWQGAVNRKGYGQLHVSNGAWVQAHRYSWQLHHGTIPEGMQVCHHCDNPSCVRPDHLFLGSALDNWQDSARKGRRAKVHGEMLPQAKLREPEIIAIRTKWATGQYLQRELATEYGVSQPSLSKIVLHQTWKHVQESTA